MSKLKALILSAMLTALAAVGVTTATAEAGTLDKILARGELRVAVQTQGPPMSFMDKTGKRVGSAIDLAKLMAKEMGVKIVFLNFDWDGLIPALLSGKADILAADVTPTLARATKVAFTKPFMYDGGVAFSKGGGKFKTIKDCEAPGTTIAVLLGSTGEKLAAKVFPSAKIKSYKGGGTLLLNAVAAGRAECGVNEISAVKAQSGSYPAGSFNVFPKMLSKEPLSYAVRYDSLDLLIWANLFIDTTRLDGRLQANLDYWVNSTKWRKVH